MKETPEGVSQQCLTPLENAAIIDLLSNMEAKEEEIARQVILLQVLVTLVGAGVVFSIRSSPEYAIAVLSGGGASVVNGVMLVWKMRQVASHPAYEAHHQLRLLYFYAAERFLVVLVLFCFCLAVLKLSPLALLGGFVAGQVVLPVGRLFLSGFKTEIVNKNV